MTWFRKRKPPVAEHPPPARESAQALAESRAKLNTEREQLVIPMRNLIEQNNVTPLVRELIRRKGAQGGRGTAPG